MGIAGRMAVVTGVYLVGALLVLVLLGAVRELLLLPEQFVGLGRWFVVGGYPVALLVAWRYPDMGGDA